ncbi:MAG: MFS transporter [Pseudonocardiales bacterium]|nr:DHA2 family efflux MFS transporter permease subunit [Actinomycetota bacterium]PZS12351.1 MAG: MFS transporter [Pseudonocardiales bacterium]
MVTNAAPAGVRMGTPAGRWVLLATISGSGMAMLDATVVNIALPSIGRDFGADFRTLQWIVNAYTLTLAALILLAGALGDRFGRRRVFVVGVVWFAVASLLCGLAPTAQVLVVARALQGIGGALLTPGSLAIISSSFAATDRARAVGAWSGLGGVAAAIGPFAGGYLVTLNWRAVFLVNLPIAVFTVVVALRHVPESSDALSPPGLDVSGAALTAVGLAGLTYALTSLSDGGGGGGVVSFVAGAGGLAALVTFVLLERRSPHPLVPLSLFASRRFSVTNAVTLLVYAALGVFFFLLVLQLQIVAGFSALVAGTAMLPVTVLMLLLSARAGALAERIGPRLPMTVGPLLAAIGLLLTLRIGRGASYLADVLPAVLVLGLGLSLTVAPLTATVLGAAAPRYAGTASGVNNAIARAGGLLAVAVIPVAAGLGGADYTDPLTFEAGFHTAMVLSAGLLALSSVLAAALLRDPHQVPTPAERILVERCSHCGVAGPQLHPAQGR